MPHWRTMTDDDGLLYAHHLGDKHTTVTITGVSAAKLIGQAGRATTKPALSLAGTTRKFAICRTDARTIERLAGSGDTDRWVGLRITLIPTTTRTSDGEVPCIRVSPKAPTSAQQDSPPHDDT